MSTQGTDLGLGVSVLEKRDAAVLDVVDLVD